MLICAARRSACGWPLPSSQTPNDSLLSATRRLHRPSRRPYAPPDGRYQCIGHRRDDRDFFVHEATTNWDVSYATTARSVTPIEQHVHSFLEMIPLMAILCVVSIHWGQFLAVFGAGPESARFDLVWKAEPLSIAYIVSVLVVILLFEFLPYAEEFLRGLRANAGELVPVPARNARGQTTLR
jgi:hypothetical protein